MQPRLYQVSPDFKNMVTTILQTKKFSSVFPFMNLINRDGFIYAEDELNQIVQFLGEFSYNEVSDFFRGLPNIVTELENSKYETNPTENALETNLAE